ncbi:tetratricopeptide repeat protein [Amycolatopsis sp. DG1A-15b]|uniref:ATP-binding protein n=1 Tax=Amycolatopsis sp. DG1A-15b TaxID=3052846 RepID=UPI00255B89A8|nr:tetratricopeptide repeat protein [Amycolatopsis sp. DG1A-15b]WIX91066.1 NB-ARC domain-containing protein [Amycolatopsis sp. DG1A-15b]
MTENERLRAARERTGSRQHPGECLSRRELAELVNACLWEHHRQRTAVDDNYVAKLERGTIRWPNARYRAAFRAVLDAGTDADLGFANSRRPAAPVTERRAVSPVPHQLPAPPLRFTARVDELKELSAACDGGRVGDGAVLVISAVAGAGGVGKTALALHWAHRELDRFPDGQLYVDLRGFDPAGPPMPPETAIRGFLDAFGVATSAIPAGLTAQAALYRTLVSGKRMLIVLDNARDSAAAEPLLPGSAGCTVIVTSRHHLTGLVARGAHAMRLPMFTPGEAGELLVKHLGAAKVDAEADASAALVRFCAGLPLAISIVAARAGSNPAFPLALLAAELADETGRLDGLDAGEASVRLSSVFSASYRALDDEAADLLRHLGLAPGADVPVAAIAGLTGRPGHRIRRQLRTLEHAHLLQQHRPGRYRMHDLVRLYARDRAQTDLSEAARDQAIRRFVGFYLHTAFAAERLLDDHRPSIDLPPPPPGCHPAPLDDHAAAVQWFAEEHANLLTAQQCAIRRGWVEEVWRIAWTVNTHHMRHDRRDDNLRVWQPAIDAVTDIRGRSDQADVHRLYGWARVMVGDHGAGMTQLGRALELFRQAGDVAGQARAHEALAAAWEQQGDPRRALAPARQALTLYEGLGQAARIANALNTVGWQYARLGELDQATRYCTAALRLFRRLRYLDAEAYALHSLGYIDHQAARHPSAVRHYRRAVNLLRGAFDPKQEAVVLADLAEVYASAHRYRRARHLWLEALALFRRQHRASDIERIERRLAALA